LCELHWNCERINNQQEKKQQSKKDEILRAKSFRCEFVSHCAGFTLFTSKERQEQQDNQPAVLRSSLVSSKELLAHTLTCMMDDV
jgi:hypothetical protein